MDISLSLSPQDQARVAQEVNTFNRTLNEGKGAKANMALDKNDFLKILITQLSHQDPTQPMDDKAFIAQMAQFSSLEQMTNMSTGFQKVSGLLASSEASQVLGKTVEIRDGENLVTGVVDRVVRGESPLVGVNGKIYDFSQIESVVSK